MNNLRCIFILSLLSISVQSSESKIKDDTIAFENSTLSMIYRISDFVMQQGYKWTLGYMHNSFIESKKNNAVSFALFNTYIDGKLISQDINRTYLTSNLLQKAFDRGDIDLTKTLLFLGADPHKPNFFGISAVDTAHQKQSQEFSNLYAQYKSQSGQQVHENKTETMSLFKKIFDNSIRAAAALGAQEGLNYIVAMLQEQSKSHRWLSKVFMYMISGYRFEDMLNQSWIKQTALQYAMKKNDLDFARMLLYLGANPLQNNSCGNSAFVKAVKTQNLPFVKLFWKYISLYGIKENVVLVVQPYLLQLLECGIQDSCDNQSDKFLLEVKTYFNVTSDDVIIL